jgi:hypothetical protein
LESNKSTFFIFEHSFQSIESATYIIEKIKSFLNNIQPNAFFNPDDIRLILAPSLRELETVVNEIHSVPYNEKETLYEIAFILNELVANVQSFFSFFEDAINQRTHPRLSQYNNDFIQKLKKNNLNLMDCYLALDRVFKFFMNQTFSRSQDYVHVYLSGPDENDFGAITFRPPVERSTKYFLPFTVPSIDVIRTRRWAAVSHEAAHQKIAKIASHQQNIFNKLDEIVEDFSSLLTSKPFDELELLDRYLISKQIEEILCDITSVLMVGPASPFAFLTYGPLGHAGRISDHPPLSVRVEYMLRILRHLESCYGPTDLGEDLDMMKEDWASYVNLAMQSPHSEVINHDYINKHLIFINRHLDKLENFVSNRVIRADEANRFLPAKWGIAKRFVENGLKMDFPEINQLDIPALLNIPWIRIKRDFPIHKNKWLNNQPAIQSRFDEIKYSNIIVERILSMPYNYFVNNS